MEAWKYQSQVVCRNRNSSVEYLSVGRLFWTDGHCRGLLSLGGVVCVHVWMGSVGIWQLRSGLISVSGTSLCYLCGWVRGWLIAWCLSAHWDSLHLLLCKEVTSVRWFFTAVATAVALVFLNSQDSPHCCNCFAVCKHFASVTPLHGVIHYSLSIPGRRQAVKEKVREDLPRTKAHK